MREPLFKIMLRLRKMTLGTQCEYLAVCVSVEPKASSRRRELSKLLLDTRTRQIRHEIGQRRRSRDAAAR